MTREEVHALVLSFPETEEGTSYGMPSYKAFGKFFTRLRAEDDSLVLACVPFEERELLCEMEPDVFHFTEHYRNYPYVLARIGPADAEQLRGFLTRQWRKHAPKRWLKAWDEERGA